MKERQSKRNPYRGTNSNPGARALFEAFACRRRNDPIGERLALPDAAEFACREIADARDAGTLGGERRRVCRGFAGDSQGIDRF
jgi:hypothetical protein